MPYWRLFYHIVWTTKNRLPLIEFDWEEKLYGYIWGKADALGCIPHAINGMPDHLHVVISIPPKLIIATIVGKLKGASSYHVNHAILGEKGFAWQNEYGVTSFSERNLPAVVAYVQKQKQHHTDGALWANLETVVLSQLPGYIE
jgi:putative transposase